MNNITIALSHDLLIYVSIKALYVSLNHRRIYARNPIHTDISPNGFVHRKSTLHKNSNKEYHYRHH